MSCREVRQQVLEMTLEGTIPADGPVAHHLRECPACRVFAARLAEVDAALWSLPLEAAPAQVAEHVLERIPSSPYMGEQKLLPWTLWLPVISLVAGISWAYLALVWQHRSNIYNSLDPTVVNWAAQMQQWLASNRPILSVVALSVTVGLLFTVLAVGLGLYVGRERPATSQ